jgi:hypothetical protein
VNKRDAFNSLFDAGMNYEGYKKRSPKHHERMQAHWNAADAALRKIPYETIKRLNRPLKVLCIAENWCGDCANDIPVIARMSDQFDQWDLSIVGREAHDDLVVEYYLTAGRKKIPVIVFADDDGDEIVRWIERPTRSYRILADLQSERLPKEEYIQKYQSISELKAPSLSEEILRELLDCADKAVSMIRILPVKKY